MRRDVGRAVRRHQEAASHPNVLPSQFGDDRAEDTGVEGELRAGRRVIAVKNRLHRHRTSSKVHLSTLSADLGNSKTPRDGTAGGAQPQM